MHVKHKFVYMKSYLGTDRICAKNLSIKNS